MGAVSVDQRAPIGPLPVGAKLGRYEILGKLAAGGMAIVYVARAHGVAGFERLVAIKVLHGNLAHEEEFIKMFLDEARLAASIRHPNVVPTMDISDSEKSGYFIVMEYIEGDHLGQLLSSANKAGEKLPISVTLRVICDALGGLGAAHDLVDEQGRPQNLVHRDVSPHNIMVGRDGVARLTDFGVAKAEDRLTHTRDGQVKGKLAYMAPEQAASGMTDVRSDLFSMGVILWECLTGQRLMRAESTGATLHKLLHGEIPKPSSIEPTLAPLDSVLEVALSRDPAQRFQNAEAFARALEDVAHHFGGAASLREVGRVVKHHAAAKLKRDKKLIDEALKALRPASTTTEGSAAMFTDETSSPTSPSNTEISVVANAPSIISKVGGNTVANETMPGTRRATRRTMDVPIPEAVAEDHVSPPAAVSGVAPTVPEVLAAMGVSGELPVVSSSELSPSVMPTAIAAFPAGAREASPGGVSEIAAQSDATANRSVQRLRVAVLLLGVAALVLLALWAGGNAAPEVVQVEEMTPAEHVASGHLNATPTTGPATRTGEAAHVVPVATIPASTSEDVVTAPVNVKAPAAQPIVPVVRSAASGATPAAVSGNRTREVAPKPVKPTVRRHVKATARPTDVIPNPYHD